MTDAPSQAELLAEVREWLCEACDAVYPGPPQDGVWCVICPKCGGDTGPRGYIERKKLKAALTALVKMIDTHRRIYEYEKQQYVIDEGSEWATARALIGAGE